MTRLLFACLLFLAIPALAARMHGGNDHVAVSTQEFAGPYASWTNVKTTCGAVGDGTTDDSSAIQTCLNGLSSTWTTVYFPAGTYKVTTPLTMSAKLYISLIGADPATTTILWAGASGAHMLTLNGVAYSRLDRLTFNGGGIANDAIDQSWDGTTGNFDTGNEYADDVFENLTNAGIACGWLRFGCAETAMLRDKFLNITGFSAITLGNANALDMWVWYSSFVNDATGVTNQFEGGNFQVVDSSFQGSTVADLTIENTGLFTLRGNYSIGSNQFLGPSEGTDNSANITIQGNTILDTTASQSINVGNLGPVVLIDNTVRSLSPATAPIVQVTGPAASDLFSMGNTFTVASPTFSSGHYHSVQDQVVSRGSITPSPPVQPGTPQNLGRTVYEATTTGQIISGIASAAGTCNNAVVHIQPGTYNVSSTIVVPANCPIQIIGDGGYSLLNWTGGSGGPLMQLTGPSKVTLSDFRMEGSGAAADGVDVTNADQANSRVFMEQLLLTLSGPNLYVDHLDYTNVELHDFQHSGTSPVATSINVVGGPSAGGGSWLGGATSIFLGASSGNYISYGVSNGAHVAVDGVWHDGGGTPTPHEVASITGNSTFTYAGSPLYLPSGPTASIALNNFGGTAALINLLTQEPVNITGNGTGGQVLGLGLVGMPPSFFNDTTSPADTTEFLNGLVVCTGTFPPDTSPCPNPNTGEGAVEIAEAPSSPSTPFLTATLSQLRSTQPTVPAALPGGVTDARLYRVYVDNFATGIHLAR
jgi:hypothetical protein